MALEAARTALLEEIFGGDTRVGNRGSSSTNMPTEHALQQIVDGCFVKLQRLRVPRCDVCGKVYQTRSHLITHYFDIHIKKERKEPDTATETSEPDIVKKPEPTNILQLRLIADDTDSHVKEELKQPDVTTEKSETDIVEKCVPEPTNIRQDRTDDNDLKIYPCDICNKIFAFKVNMEIHKLEHLGKEPITYEYSQNHANENQSGTPVDYHTAEKLYPCYVCEKTFGSLDGLSRHEKRHSGIKPFSCKFCRKNFQLKVQMKTHERMHTGDKPYSCTMCDRQFLYHSSLSCHRATHINMNDPTMVTKLLQCDNCNKLFRHRPNLIKHMQKHKKTELYSCDLCELKFSWRGNLKRHRKKHIGDLPHPCSYCGKKFAEKYQLARHTESHTKNKPYTCKFCEKRFARTDILTRHLETHTKAYPCKLCLKSFTNKTFLDRHVGLEHNKPSAAVKTKNQKHKLRRIKQKKNYIDSDSSSSE